VEDMLLLQESLAHIINSQEDMEVVGVTANASEALALCREITPDLALIDVVTENKPNGIAAAAEIRREMPNVKIVLMTALPEITFIDGARKAGAHSFVYKDSTSQHVLYVIRCTMTGKGVYPGPDDEAFIKARFSDAEMAVIRLVCQGKRLNEITVALSISEDNAMELISSILSKTGFDSITKFAIYAVANSFVMPDKNMLSEQNTRVGTDDLREFMVSNNVDMSLLDQFKQNVKKLSAAEYSVFNFYLEGYSAEQISEKLFVSINTIKSHNKKIYEKLKVSSLKELRLYAQMMKMSK